MALLMASVDMSIPGRRALSQGWRSEFMKGFAILKGDSFREMWLTGGREPSARILQKVTESGASDHTAALHAPIA